MIWRVRGFRYAHPVLWKASIRGGGNCLPNHGSRGNCGTQTSEVRRDLHIPFCIYCLWRSYDLITMFLGPNDFHFSISSLSYVLVGTVCLSWPWRCLLQTRQGRDGKNKKIKCSKINKTKHEQLTVFSTDLSCCTFIVCFSTGKAPEWFHMPRATMASRCHNPASEFKEKCDPKWVKGHSQPRLSALTSNWMHKVI